MFTQVLDPTGSPFITWLVALVPVAALLVLLAVFRVSAWLATLIGSIVTFLLAAWVWHMPLGDGVVAYLYGSASGVWNVDWITLWGVMLFNTLVVTGVFENFRRWLIAQGSADVRVQTMLFAWAFGALLEGLVGFGYPWAFVAPILISLGIPDLDAIRVAAIANNAPVSYGALGAPIIALATVTGLPLLTLSSSVGHVVAVLALLPPWVLLYLVSGKDGMWEAWPLAVVGSLGYIVGQLPVAAYLGPYVPDVAGGITCFAALLILLKVWHPATVRAMAARSFRPPIRPGSRAASTGSPRASCSCPGCPSSCWSGSSSRGPDRGRSCRATCRGRSRSRRHPRSSRARSSMPSSAGRRSRAAPRSWRAGSWSPRSSGSPAANSTSTK